MTRNVWAETRVRFQYENDFYKGHFGIVSSLLALVNKILKIFLTGVSFSLNQKHQEFGSVDDIVAIWSYINKLDQFLNTINNKKL